MVLLIPRSIEESYLLESDGSCGNSLDCVCMTDIGSKIPGKSLLEFDLSKCVLCYRKEVSYKYDGINTPIKGKYNPYVNIDYEYERDILIGCENKVDRLYYGVTGPFVRYNPKDYTLLKDSNKIVQTMDIPKGKCKWLSSLFKLKLTKVEKPFWNICYCGNVICKNKLLSFKDRHRATGITGTYLNLSDESIRCDKCDCKVNYKTCDPESGLVEYDGDRQYLTRCVFCRTLVDFLSWRTIQGCTKCMNNHFDQYKISNIKCQKCNNLINNTRRKNAQEVKMRKRDNNDVISVYFCKQHRISMYDGRVFDEEEIEDLI